MAEERSKYREGIEDWRVLGATTANQRDGKLVELSEYAATDDLYTWQGG